jgi:hypothetical protein
MDNVLIVVDDLEATKAFFLALGLTLTLAEQVGAVAPRRAADVDH